MKNLKKYLIVVLLIGIFTVTGCSSNKKALTVSEVKEKVENIGFKVIDSKAKFNGTDYVTNALEIGNSNFYVEFIELNDVDTAKTLFQNNKEQIDGNRKGDFKNNSSSGNNYETYELISDGYYMYICRIDNTILYVDDKVEFESEMKQIVKALNY